eukprot:6192340-Pleurochrysis_carterae.AAC.1
MAERKGTPGTTPPHRFVVTRAEGEKCGRGARPEGVFAERPSEIKGWSMGGMLYTRRYSSRAGAA